MYIFLEIIKNSIFSDFFNNTFFESIEKMY